MNKDYHYAILASRKFKRSMSQIVVKSRSPASTYSLGKRLGKRLQAGSVIALVGELGCGKTLLTRGICEGLGVHNRYVNSPTFMLVNEYRGRINVYHMDLYRLETPEDAFGIGIFDYFSRGREGVIIVEWAERIASLLPEERLTVEFEVVSSNERSISLTGTGSKYEKLLEGLR